MHNLESYYLNQAGRGRPRILRPALPPTMTRDRPFMWSGVKAVGHEKLRTGVKILSDKVENKSAAVRAGDNLFKQITTSTQRLDNKLRGRGLKRFRETCRGRETVGTSLEKCVPE